MVVAELPDIKNLVNRTTIYIEFHTFHRDNVMSYNSSKVSIKCIIFCVQRRISLRRDVNN